MNHETKEEEYTFFFSGVFSQFHQCSFSDDKNRVFSCAEKYMMFEKAILFNDQKSADAIMLTTTPKQAKRLGRKVLNFNQSVWDAKREDIVTQGNMYKFKQNPTLLKMLLDTKQTTLVEASPYDRIWGIGYRAHNATQNKQNWGLNLLGKCLMTVREGLVN